jgi:hypothetical protein
VIVPIAYLNFDSERALILIPQRYISLVHAAPLTTQPAVTLSFLSSLTDILRDYHSCNYCKLSTVCGNCLRCTLALRNDHRRSYSDPRDIALSDAAGN